MTYQEIKRQTEKDMEELAKKVGLFWAFSNDQFTEGRAKILASGLLIEGEKVASIGAGGYLPTKNWEAFDSGYDAIIKTEKQAVKDARSALDEAIRYEIMNHEGNIEDALQVTKHLGATKAKILSTYRKMTAGGASLYA